MNFIIYIYTIAILLWCCHAAIQLDNNYTSITFGEKVASATNKKPRIEVSKTSKNRPLPDSYKYDFITWQNGVVTLTVQQRYEQLLNESRGLASLPKF